MHAYTHAHVEHIHKQTNEQTKAKPVAAIFMVTTTQDTVHHTTILNKCRQILLRVGHLCPAGRMITIFIRKFGA